MRELIFQESNEVSGGHSGRHGSWVAMPELGWSATPGPGYPIGGGSHHGWQQGLAPLWYKSFVPKVN